jgi:hypothetical protein
VSRPEWGAILKLLDLRYLIDLITGISDVPSGLAPLDSDPGVDSTSYPTSVHPTNRRWPTMRANLRMAAIRKQWNRAVCGCGSPGRLVRPNGFRLASLKAMPPQSNTL